MARGWDFIIPPLREKVKSLQLSSLRSLASIAHTIMGSPRYSGINKGLAGFAQGPSDMQNLLPAEASLRGHGLEDLVKVNPCH